MKRILHYKILLFVVLLCGCKEVYDPPALSSKTNYLVIEGVLNTNGATNIFISRTYSLNDTGRLRGELGANITVEGDGGFSAPLVSSGDGNYTSGNLNLALGSVYRVRITTTDGKVFLSDDIIARATPPISSVDWERDGQDLRISVSTEDPTNNSRFYRWEFEETWEVKAYYFAKMIYDPINNFVRYRNFPEEDISVCYNQNRSSSILLGSSVRLQSDIINKAPVQLIPFGDERISSRYSILVKQYTLPAAGYEFYELMKRNTEEIGSVFGPLPSELRGNIRCISDPSVYVLGYLSAATIEEKRIFIRNGEIPDWQFFMNCRDSLVDNNPEALKRNFGNDVLMPYEPYFGPNSAIIGYFASEPICVDCRKKGGTTVRPNYW